MNIPLHHFEQTTIGPDDDQQEQLLNELNYKRPHKKIQFNICSDDVIHNIVDCGSNEVLKYIIQLDRLTNDKNLTEMCYRYFRKAIRQREVTAIITELNRDIDDQTSKY